MKEISINHYDFVSDALYEIFEHLVNASARDSFEFIMRGCKSGLIVTPQLKYYKDGTPAIPFEFFTWERYNERCAVYRSLENGWVLEVDDHLFFISMPSMEPDGFEMNCWYRNFYTRGDKNSLV